MGGEIVHSFRNDGISHMAHLVGGAVGAAFGFLGGARSQEDGRADQGRHLSRASLAELVEVFGRQIARAPRICSIALRAAGAPSTCSGSW